MQKVQFTREDYDELTKQFYSDNITESTKQQL